MIPREIILDGESIKINKGRQERYLAYFDGCDIAIAGTEFTLLNVLILKGDLDGAVATNDFGFPESSVRKYLWELRKAMHEMLPDYSGWPVYDYRRDRKYSLSGRPSITVKVSGKLKQFNDSRVSVLACRWLAKNRNGVSLIKIRA